MSAPQNRWRLARPQGNDVLIWFKERRHWGMAGLTVFILLVAGLVVALVAQQKAKSAYDDDLARRTVMRRILRMRAMTESALKDCTLAARLKAQESLYDCRDALDALQGQAAGDASRVLFLEAKPGFDVSLLDTFERSYSDLEGAFAASAPEALDLALSTFQVRGNDIVAALDKVEAAFWNQEVRARERALANIDWVHASLRFLVGVLVVSFIAFAFFAWRAFRSFHALRREKAFASQQSLIMEGSLASAELAVVATGLAHEINNPLTVILGQALRLGTEEPEKFGPLAATLVRQTERIGAVVKDFARATSPRPADPAFTADVRETLEALSHYFGDARVRHGVAVDIEVPTRPARVALATHHLFQCLHNLILNALQAVSESAPRTGRTPAAVRVRVSFPPSDAAPETTEGATTVKKTVPVRVVVEDDGPGISESDCERIFLPFFSTHAQRRGLGLTAARTLAALGGGRVTVESTQGPTRIVLELP